MSELVLPSLFEAQPEARVAYEQCVGYIVADMSLTKVPVFGAGKGYGIVIDKAHGGREYVEVSQFQVGGGLGAQKFKVVVLFTDGALLEQAMSGFWHFDAGAEAGSGHTSAAGTTAKNKGYRAYKIAESGVVASLTLRAVRAKPL